MRRRSAAQLAQADAALKIAYQKRAGLAAERHCEACHQPEPASAARGWAPPSSQAAAAAAADGAAAQADGGDSEPPSGDETQPDAAPAPQPSSLTSNEDGAQNLTASRLRLRLSRLKANFHSKRLQAEAVQREAERESLRQATVDLYAAHAKIARFEKLQAAAAERTAARAAAAEELAATAAVEREAECDSLRQMKADLDAAHTEIARLKLQPPWLRMGRQRRKQRQPNGRRRQLWRRRRSAKKCIR